MEKEDANIDFLLNKESTQTIENTMDKENKEDANSGEKVYNKSKKRHKNSAGNKKAQGGLQNPPEAAKDECAEEVAAKSEAGIAENKSPQDKAPKEKQKSMAGKNLSKSKAYNDAPKTKIMVKDGFCDLLTGPRIDFVTGLPKKFKQPKLTKAEIESELGYQRVIAYRVKQSKEAAQKILEEAAAKGITLPMLVSCETGEVKVIEKDEFSVGYLYFCDFSIKQPDPENHTVSRIHAYIYKKQDGTVFVKDDSLNGTFVGTDIDDDMSFYRLPKGHEVQIKDKMYIKFADAAYQFFIKGEV